MGTAYGNTVQHWRCKVVGEVTSTTDTQCTVRCRTYWCSIGWGYAVNANAIAYVGGYNSGTKNFLASSASGASVETLVAEVSHTYSRTNSNQSITCTGSATIYGGYHNGTSSATTTATIPARIRSPHGNPTIFSSSSETNYVGTVTLTWAKSATQGNASFTRFELVQGSNVLYKGSGTSLKVKPSDVTGPAGGSVTYTVREIHTWYGTEYSTSASVTVSVKPSFVCYDSGGLKRYSVLYCYDSNGNLRNAHVSCYDSNGKLTQVVQ